MMQARDAASLGPLGFLTVVEHSRHGLLGGYLLVNAIGRPLEFHCTSGVKANRAQEILYGPTLEPYLYGEQIGQTLVSKAAATPALVCTDRAAVLAVREFIPYPVALVREISTEMAAEPASSVDASTVNFRVDPPHFGAGSMDCFCVGHRSLAVAVGHASDRDQVIECLAMLGDGFDLNEPFARIQAAIDEAQGGGR